MLYVNVADGHVGALCHGSPDNARTISVVDVPAEGFAFPKGPIIVDEPLVQLSAACHCLQHHVFVELAVLAAGDEVLNEGDIGGGLI